MSDGVSDRRTSRSPLWGQIKNSAQLVAGEETDRRILRLLHVLLENRLLLLEERVDSLLDGIGHEEPYNLQRSVPPEPMCSLDGLVLHRWIPPSIEHDHDGGAGQVQPNPTCPQ